VWNISGISTPLPRVSRKIQSLLSYYKYLYRVFRVRCTNLRCIKRRWVIFNKRGYFNTISIVNCHTSTSILIFRDTVWCHTVSVFTNNLHAYSCISQTLLTRNSLLRSKELCVQKNGDRLKSDHYDVTENWRSLFLSNQNRVSSFRVVI